MIHVPPGSEQTFLSPLPVEKIPGVGPKAHRELLQQKIKTIGDLLSHPALRNRYLDLEEAEQQEHDRNHSIGKETTLEKPLREIKQMEEVLWQLVEEVGERLRQEGSYARCITVKIRYTNFKTITRSRTLSVPSCFDREIFEVARDLLKKNLSRAGSVRLLGVITSSLQNSGWQESMFDIQKRRSWEKLYRGIDRLRQKYGEEVVGVATRRARTKTLR